MKQVKVRPKKSITDLCEILEDYNVEEFENFLDNSIEESLDIEENDGVDIGIIITNQIEGINLSLEQRIKFLSKLNVNSASKKEHFDALCGIINLTRDVEIMKSALAAGFDPSADNGYHDVLEIAVQQCQVSDKSAKEVKFINYDNENSDSSQSKDNLERDIELIKLMLRTGKIADFYGNSGAQEAERINQVQRLGEFPISWNISEKNFDGVNCGSITRTYKGEEKEIIFDYCNLNRARAYISHLYYSERPLVDNINSEKVSLETLEGNRPSTSLCSRLASIFSCFAKSNEYEMTI